MYSAQTLPQSPQECRCRQRVRWCGLQAAMAPGVATICPSWNFGAKVEALVSCVMVWLPSVSLTSRIGGEGSRGGAMGRAVIPPTGSNAHGANGAGRGLTGRQHRRDSANAPSAGGTARRGPEQGREPGASDHPIWAGRIQHRQQLLQHRSHRRPAIRLVHRLKDPRRDVGLDLLQAVRAVHQ